MTKIGTEGRLFLGGQSRPIPSSASPASPNFWDPYLVQTVWPWARKFHTITHVG